MIKERYNLFEGVLFFYSQSWIPTGFFIDLICISQLNPNRLVSDFNGWKNLPSSKSLNVATESLNGREWEGG